MFIGHSLHSSIFGHSQFLILATPMPKSITHLTTNCAQQRATLLIEITTPNCKQLICKNIQALEQDSVCMFKGVVYKCS